MIERAQATVPDASGITAGTFHSICARILRRFAAKIGFSSSFEIVDESDQKEMMGQCIKDLISNPKDFPKKSVILSWISSAMNKERDIEQHIRSMQSSEAMNVEDVLKVVNAYIKKKEELKVMDFDDLLVNTLKLLVEHKDVREFLQNKFRYILVDEYQDTNSLQAQITDILAEKHRNLMVVGDDFQCIYTWRGARFENIREFPERWSDCKVIKLESNYRSVPSILTLANTVMRDVPKEFAKQLRPVRSENEKLPKIFNMWDGTVQSELVVQLVSQLYESGRSYKDIAILYRSHYSSIEIQMALTRAAIPFIITSGIGVFEQLHVKDMLAFLRLCIDGHSELAFMLLILLLPSVGQVSAKKCWEKCGKYFLGTEKGAPERLTEFLPSRARAAWEDLVKTFNEAAEFIEEGQGTLAIVSFIDNFYARHLRNSFEEDDATSRIDDLKEVATQIKDGSAKGLATFLSEVALMTNLDAKAKQSLPEDHITLTTVHQAKGMEWPCVILPWLTEGMFPSQKAIDEGNLDEERRLFYVALTRAKDRLFMCTPKMKKSVDGGSFPCAPSLFIEEMPKYMVEEQSIRSSNTYQSPYSNRYGGSYGGGYNRGGSSWGRGKSSGYTTTWRR